MLKSVGVFLGGSSQAEEQYQTATRELGLTLAQQGRTIIYGGGHIGLMGLLADTALAAGGNVIGIIPQHLVDREIAHKGLSELRIVKDMAERKAVMAQLSDGFIALPGGFGTLDEVFEMVTWTQIGVQAKATALLNVGEYYTPLMQWLEQAVQSGLVRGPHRNLLLSDQTITGLLTQLDRWSLPEMPKL